MIESEEEEFEKKKKASKEEVEEKERERERKESVFFLFRSRGAAVFLSFLFPLSKLNPTTTRKTPNFLLLPPSHSYPVTACIASNTIEKSGRAISALMAPKSKTSCSVFR